MIDGPWQTEAVVSMVAPICSASSTAARCPAVLLRDSPQMSGARLSRRISAARATALASGAGWPSIVAGGRADGSESDANHGSARRHAPSACVTRLPENVSRRSSHTQPQTVQATSENVCGMWIQWHVDISQFYFDLSNVPLQRRQEIGGNTDQR